MDLICQRSIFVRLKNYIMDLSQQDWKSKLENDPNAIILDVRTEE